MVVLFKLSVLAKWLAIKTLLRKPVRGKQAKEYLWLFVFVYCFIVLLCVCLVPWPYNIFPTPMARYSLFVLKVPLNINQPTNHQDITPESWSLLGHTTPAVMDAYPLICLRKILSNIYISVWTNQGKVDRSDPVLISLCSSVVQNRSSTEL